MDALLPYLPKLVEILAKLIMNIVEMSKGMSEEEIKKYLDMTFGEIAVEKRLKRNADGKLEWSE